MNLQFKFRPDTTPDERDAIVARLTGKGADVEQVFPDEASEGLGALYSAHVDDKRIFSTVLRWLKDIGSVDYAEPEAGRAIYLPEEMGSADQQP